MSESPRFDYRIDPAIFVQHPGYRRGVVFVRDCRNGPSPDALTALLRAAEADLRQAIRGNVAEHPVIAAWREAYRRFGAKPAEHRSSIEAMARRVLKPDALPSINALVDIGNLISLRHCLPAGVHPAEDLVNGVVLRLAQAGDTFLPPGGGEPESPTAGEIVFADGAQVLTRRWTWRQAAQTQTQDHTRSVFFNVDGLPPISADGVNQAMQDIAELVTRFCGGQIRLVVLDTNQPQITDLQR